MGDDRSGDRPGAGPRRVDPVRAEDRYNEVTLDDEGRVVRLREKPPDPETDVTAIAAYFFPPDVVELLESYLGASDEHDAPGRFISWLVERTRVEGFFFEGRWFDTGSPEDLRAARLALGAS